MRLGLYAIALAISSLAACKQKAVTIPQVVTVPGVVFESEPISLETLWKNDSIVIIDRSKSVVVIKRDTVRKTVQIRSECPDVKVQRDVQLIEIEKEKKVIDWWLVLTVSAILAILLSNLFKRFV